MDDILTSIIGIGIAAVLMFIFPLITMSDRTDDISQLTVEIATTEFVDDIRYKLKTGSDAETTLLEIDKYSVTDEDTTPKYRARLWNVAIEISSNAGDSAKVNYNIHYIGDPTFGTVTFSNGVPTFTEETTTISTEG